jgi:four helix bundle protein
VQPYERFAAWQRCHEFVLLTYEITASWPVQHRYGITAQLHRAALSAPTNIVEGSAKFGRNELRRFLDISVGSLAEAGYLLRVVRDIGILSRDDWDRLEGSRSSAAKVLWLLYRSLGVRVPRNASP